MFWRFGVYASISAIDTLLEKPNVSLEDLLDETELIQELKQHNAKLIEYLHEDIVLKRLLDYVIAPSLVHEDDDEDEVGEEKAEEAGLDTSSTKGQKAGDPLKEILDPEELEKIEQTRLKHAYVACEILSSETWSIVESIMVNTAYLRDFWNFLRRPAPLDPAQASYFTKVNETLFDKKTKEMLDFLKSLDGIIPAMLQHVDNPTVMDLLLKIISLEKAKGGQGIVDWLKSHDLIPLLLSFLSPEYPISVQTSAGDFLKAIITISANATQNDQSCIGPNSLTRQLVSAECVKTLIAAMLKGGNPLTVGVGIVIEVIRKNNSDYDPENIGGPDAPPTAYDPIYLGTLLRLFAAHIPDFMNLVRSSKYSVNEGDKMKRVEREQLNSAWGAKIEPLGFDRFKTCELMAELLHCSNMGLLNEPGSHEYVRQRDAERERLIREGIYNFHRERSSGADFHDSTGDFGNGSTLDSGLSEDPKILEVTNAGDDDGFEDVTSSGVLVDRDKEAEGRRGPLTEDEDQPDIVCESQPGNRKEADRFFEEPFLESAKTGSSTHESSNEPTVHVLSLQSTNAFSPTASGLTDHVGEIKLESDQPSGNRVEESVAGHPSSPEAGNKSEDYQVHRSPPLASFSSLPEQALPHLYETSSQSESSSHLGPGTNEQAPNPENEKTMPHDTIEIDPNQFIQFDIDGQPVVGDYLKIMFVENQVVPTILGFFFRFPWNNFLHNVVYDVVQQVFNGPMDRGYNRLLAIDVFETGQITQQIMEGQRRNDETQMTKHIRLGYMGHLTLIAEEVVKFSERHPPEMLSQTVVNNILNPEWIDYVEQTLSETRERDNAILGGVRPDISIGQRQAVLGGVGAGQGLGNSTALADAGLSGVGSSNFQGFDMINQGSASGGAFGLSSNSSLFSGFGSSSDDEDEEMEDSGEKTSTDVPTESDEDNASSSSTSQPIPILPPPPAPLSLGPSRARRQLAARLAAQKQQASDNLEEIDGRVETDDHESEERQWTHNSFLISAVDEDINDPESTTDFPSMELFSRNAEASFSSPTFPDSGFSPPDSLSTNSSDDNVEGRTEAVRRKVRVPLEVDDNDDDDEMGEMVGPSLSANSGIIDSDDDDDAIISESLDYSNTFAIGQYKSFQRSRAMASHFDEDQNDSSDDDGLVEILVPSRKSSTGSSH